MKKIDDVAFSLAKYTYKHQSELGVVPTINNNGLDSSKVKRLAKLVARN